MEIGRDSRSSHHDDNAKICTPAAYSISPRKCVACSIHESFANLAHIGILLQREAFLDCVKYGGLVCECGPRLSNSVPLISDITAVESFPPSQPQVRNTIIF